MHSRATGLASGLGALAVALAASSIGCRSKASHGAGAQGAISAAAPSEQAPAAAASTALPPPTSTAQLPEGPVLAIQAGKGVGPIRLGATVATIERLMAAPCDVKTAQVCRYFRRAVEFYLDAGGATERIVVHRKDRPAGLDASGKPQAYGFFNGGIPPGVGLGMIPKAVLEMLGKPVKSERVTDNNAFHTLDRDTYPGGLLLEYDEYTNGRVMLGGVVITKPEN